ncbi:MAG: cell division protein FtsL [Lachnospiraceae bacterium]|nr:cell division protein FtsL [Lachnospiraceae bacterium]
MAGRSSYNNRPTSRVYGSTAGNMYVDGNTVRKVQRKYLDVPPRRSSRALAEERARARAIRWANFKYGLFLLIALTISAAVCIWYVRLRSEITASQIDISNLIEELNDKKLANDEEYERIMGAVDLEEIKRIAMNDLGMKYPTENQVVNISGAGDDYVRQYNTIPEY